MTEGVEQRALWTQGQDRWRGPVCAAPSGLRRHLMTEPPTPTHPPTLARRPETGRTWCVPKAKREGLLSTSPCLKGDREYFKKAQNSKLGNNVFLKVHSSQSFLGTRRPLPNPRATRKWGRNPISRPGDAVPPKVPHANGRRAACSPPAGPHIPLS